MPCGVHVVVDGEGQVVVVQFDKSLGQHLTSAQGLVCKLVCLELETTTQGSHGEVQQLKEDHKILKGQFVNNQNRTFPCLQWFMKDNSKVGQK